MASAKEDELSSLTFDLVQVGTSYALEPIPFPSSNSQDGDKHKTQRFPLITLPAGLPPVIPPLKDDVEKLLTDLEGLSIHDFRRCQRIIPREPQFDRLLHTDVCPVQTQIKVERHASTGKVLGYSEELIPDNAETSRNSLSLRRAPDTSNAGTHRDLRGSNINLPFWPGGLEDDPILSSLDPTVQVDVQADVNFTNESSYRTVPPSFASGMTFESGQQEGDSDVAMDQDEGGEGKVELAVSSMKAITLTDIMAAEDDLDFGDSDEEEDGKDGDEGALAQTQEQTQVVQDGDALDSLVEVEAQAESSKRDAVPKAEKPTKEQWAVQVDVNSPVKDFYKRIPVMAYKWPFELDIFQKQAILRLENHESVFVAAHTSAGKTVVAEYAIALSLKHMTRTIYTSPIKALSNQKFRDFKVTFGDVGLVTGDVQLNQTAGCLIMTTEILRSMLYNGSDVIRDLEWVIFDEVHYINDSERGVVWEEVLIMLPQHVNVILLSATVPNSMEFADWVGRTKRKKMYVVSTLKRPVPLEHFLYTGNSTKTCNELFLLLDAKGSFLTTGYNKALEAKKERTSKSSQSFGAKGVRQGNPSQDKNVWLSVIEMLKRKDKLPAVCFIFSKKKIEETSAALHHVDLTTASEKSQIHVFFHKCIARLKGPDKKLPQVLQLENLLKRGLGLHHSGVLPILKEVVEMLFQKGLLKILFATETFAMGVNMPARTVIFENIRKHDGTNFRNLLPGEYIQMAGRAGRRGLDSTGTVMLLCKGDVPEMSELHKMMLGKPTRLESQFRLTYAMILNLMRVEQLRVQDMMRRSFSEFHQQKEAANNKEALEKLRLQMGSIKNIECYLCSLDLEKYYADCVEFYRLQNYLQSVTFSHPAAIKSLSAGRVVMVKRPLNQAVLGVVLTCASSGRDGERVLQVLVVADKPVEGDGEQLQQQQQGQKDVKEEEMDPVLPMSLFLPEGASWHQVCELRCEDISRIATKTIKVDANGIVQDCRKREMHRFKDDLPDRCVTMATQELVRLSEANPNGLAGLHLVNDLKARDIELVELCRTFKFLEEGFGDFNCTQCSQFREHFREHSSNMQLKEEYKQLQYLLSDDSLALLPEYTHRVQVLKELHYVDASGTVQLKGRVACEISNHELMITELVFENILTDLHPTEIAALLSCFVFEMKRCTEPNLCDTLAQGKKKVLERAEMIGQMQKSVGMLMPVEDFKEQFHFGLLEVVFEWARGMPFASITELTDVQEGIIVRTIQRLHETLSDVRNAARLIGDRTLATKMETAMDTIKRDIVFAASLYTQ